MIAVIDYGLGNLRSVTKALESVGAKVILTSNPIDISSADGIVLPGVGAFYHGMNNLKKLGIISALKECINSGKPFLGICLGFQLLFTESEEHGIHKGLDILKGRVIRFPNAVKIPHMGWNQIRIQNAQNALFKGIQNDAYVYFVHSYYVEPEDKSIIATTTEYGVEFCSSIATENIFGMQFHPEKSGEIGMKVLRNYIDYID